VHYLYESKKQESIEMYQTDSICTFSVLTLFSRLSLLSKNSNSMAFISQFGEYNPGGGKDQVLKYLNESETQVLLAKKSLKTIIDALEG
jgi:hypothetical protein